MSYKSIVVSAHSLHNQRTLNTAASVAAQFDAHLSGSFVYEPIYLRYPMAYGVYLPPDLDKDRSKAEKRASVAKTAFEKACESYGVNNNDWQFAKGETLSTLDLQARCADVIFLTQAEIERTTDSQHNDPDLPAKLAIASARPVITVPCVGEFKTLGKRILVAWNGSREATRAVREALPLLRTADQVVILTINPKTSDYRGLAEEPGADIARYLARHGVNVEVTQTVHEGSNVTDTLLSRAADLSADLICMGAYGHSRLRELALGGVTRKIMRQMPVPVLLAH
ncbi:MAG: universal stress protein [Salinisphaera sp.]|jgi:nucleotide-binding universal stress UspA family protein|nr:universal stress protein [Salinisphaera sp.]